MIYVFERKFVIVPTQRIHKRGMVPEVMLPETVSQGAQNIKLRPLLVLEQLFLYHKWPKFGVFRLPSARISSAFSVFLPKFVMRVGNRTASLTFLISTR